MVNIRDYEVSIWTLQDSFIAVLKQSNLENREKIQEPKMVLKDDGDNSFSFKIPMYLKEDTDLSEQPYIKNESIWKENPIWYTVRNGNLISSLRKIKVIFNKGTSDEEVFEFIINNIKESHEGYSKFCEVECGGLAFHELGKQGYNITLSADEYNTDYQEWLNENPRSEENKPINNIDYWIKKVLDNSNWEYEICMDWSLYDGITTGDRSSARQANKVYREPYISSWKVEKDQNKLSPASSITDFNELEKRAIVNGSESNRYNLLQTIAEAFQVFCKFKYEYDDNYHITGRKVIFYNNFIKESESEKVIDFNYGYNTSQITREMDGTDLVSKMYVKPLSNSGTFYGEVNLSDTDANPSLENYLLNFNYLYKIGTISQEQYDEIPEFQKKLRSLNLSLNEENKKLMNYEMQIPLEEAKLKTADDIVKQAGERMEEASSAIGAISGGDGLVHFDNNNPKSFVIIRKANSNRCYISIIKEWQGFVPSSFNLYKDINANNSIDDNSKIDEIDFEKDDNGLITKVTFPDTGLQNKTTVYATFSYNPYTPDKVVLSIWSKKQEQAKKDKEAATNKLAELEGLKADCENNIEEYSTEKQELINKFERIMGPALREGTWQPEDEYVDYHSDKIFTVSDSGSSLRVNDNKTDGTASFVWRPSLGNKYGELEKSYAYGVNDVRYYPCIALDNKNILSGSILQQLNNENLNLVYRDPYLTGYTNYSGTAPYINNPRTDPRVHHYLRVGADNGCQFAFLKNKNDETIIPVLMVLGVDLLIDTKVGENNVTPEQQVQSEARLSIISYNEDIISEGEIMGPLSSLSLSWLTNLQNYEIVYPSFEISADRYLSTTPEHKISRDNTPLEEYEDYYAPIFNDGKYLITLKPEKVLFNLSATYKFYYSISTAAEAMYLDAIEVLRENSVPKVSYSMTPLAIEQSLMKNAYARLGQLAHINDQELKFENVQGYISEVDLDLDKPWEDTYVIKNYKTKFEDLFSTIVAQTEAMKKNSQLFNMVSNAFNSNGLLDNALIDDIKNRLDFYVPTPAEIYSQYEPQIRAELQQAFNEAGEVLAAAQNSVNDVNNLNIANAGILGTFVENIKENMTPTTFANYPRESESFKVGDVWRFTQEGVSYEYLATENSSQVNYSGETLSKTKSLRGWSLTKDGSLAQIKGASLNVDAENGTISLEAETNISLRSGKDINIQANDNLLIQANNKVDITGSQINIGSVSSSDDKGIKIVSSTASAASSASSYVDIKPSGIKMATAGGITMKGDGGINIYTSDSSNTSAIKLDRNTGIYLGSTQPIIFYSGQINASGSAASAKITSERILFGVSDGSTGTAVDLTKNYIVFGAGNVVNGNNVSNIGNKGTSGVQITKDFIRLATGDSSITSYIGMDKNGIIISNQTSSYSGGLVKINQNGIIIGTASSNNVNGIDTTTDKNNIKNDTTPRTITSSMATFQVYAPNFVVDASGHLYAYNADISGKIRATSGQIGGWNIDSNILYYGSNTPSDTSFILSPAGVNSSTSIGGSSGSNTWMLTSKNKFGVTTGGALYANSGQIGGWTLATNRLYSGSGTGYVGLDSNTSNTFAIWAGLASPTTSNYKFAVTRAGKLYATEAVISGAITATSFQLVDVKINQSDIDGLTNKLSTMERDISNTQAISASVTYAKSQYGVLNNNNLPSDITNWSANPVATDDNKPYLWTKTVTTYASGSTSTSYSISYKGKDGLKGDQGDQGKYVTSIIALYYLNNSATPPTDTNTNPPKTGVTSNSTDPGIWTKAIPNYINGYYYFRREQYTWSDGNINYTPAYLDYGITYATSTATSASQTADDLTTNVTPITAYGLIGLNTSHKNETVGTVTYDSDGYPKYGDNSYGLILGNDQPKPLLIGSNGGIHILNTEKNAAAVVMDSGGIAMNGTTIHLKTSNGSTNVISLNSTGITIGTGGKLEIGSDNFVVNNTITSGEVAFRIGPSATPYLKYTVGTGLEIKGTISLPPSTNTDTDRWEGALNKAYFWLHQAKADDDDGINGIAEEAGVRIAYNSYSINLVGENIPMMWGMSIYNMPFNICHFRSFNSDSGRQTYQSSVRLTKGRMDFSIDYKNTSNGTAVYNVFSLNAAASGTTVTEHDVVLSSTYHNLRLNGGNKIFLTSSQGISIDAPPFILNSNRLVFNDSSAPSTKSSDESATYLFRKSSAGSPPGTGWEEVKIYKKTWS